MADSVTGSTNIPPWLIGMGLGGPIGAWGAAGASGTGMPGWDTFGPGADQDPNSPHPRQWYEAFMGPTPDHLTGTLGLKDAGAGVNFREIQQPTDPNAFWDQMAQQRAGGDANRMAGPEFRQAQLNLMQQLQDQAAGKGDSLAQMQLQKGTDANIAQQMAMAQSARGASGPAMQRQAMMNAAGAQQGMAGDAAMLRLQEQMQARAALAGLSGQARGQDQSQMGMNDASSQFWAGMGSQRDQAGINRQIELERLRTEQDLQAKQAKMKAFESSQARKGNFASGIGAMLFGG